MGFRLNFVDISGWSISSIGDGGTASVGVPALSLGARTGVSVGAGGGWFEVTSNRHSDDVYRCSYSIATVDVGFGASLLGELSVGGATSSMPAVGSRILRTGPLSPDGSGETGDPTGFLGMCFLLTPAAGIGNSVTASLVLLGPPRGWQEEVASRLLPLPARFKYLGGIAGFSITSSASIGISAQPGLIYKIENRHRGGDTVRYNHSTLRHP
ncbi:MAG: hypothetical protein ACMG6S_11915, partial [Byssovorax sp.]